MSKNPLQVIGTVCLEDSYLLKVLNQDGIVSFFDLIELDEELLKLYSQYLIKIDIIDKEEQKSGQQPNHYFSQNQEKIKKKIQKLVIDQYEIIEENQHDQFASYNPKKCLTKKAQPSVKSKQERQIWKLKCILCGGWFSNKYILARHMKRMH